jgi:serine O-acetyltransferase
MTLPLDTKIGYGLRIPHNGPFVINGQSVIGENCIVHPNVLIGGMRWKGSPTIGNNVFIGNGAKIIGHITVGDWVFISPLAVITKDVPSGAVVGAGVNNIMSDKGKRNETIFVV